MAGSTRFAGILEIDPKRFGFVREMTHGLGREQHDPFVPPSLIAQFHLRPGVVLEGTASPPSTKNSREKRGPQVVSIDTVNGLSPDSWRGVAEFSRHEVISPHQLIRLEGRGSNISARIVELFCPIGRGQRALLVSPPKAGKTMLMQQLAHAISLHNTDVELLVLLIDERPEEVTDMRRSIKGNVFASSSDSERGDHVRLAQLVLEYAKRKVETGMDVVLMMDSLTRMGRAFNIHQKSSGRTMSGGVDIRALEIPKRLFGAARNIETGGSLTIIATALIETNSRMDDLIFQEFKGTGNMELVLDRSLADERIFPAINLGQSGTRREELLFGPAVQQHQALRRSIARLSPREAMLTVHKLIAQYPTNDQLLAQF